MNKTKQYGIASLLAIVLASLVVIALMTSCGKEAPEPEIDSQTEIRLSTGIEVSRAAFAGTDTQIASGETVSAWVDQVATGTPQLYGKNTLTADGSGGLSGGSSMYFPLNGDNVDIYALHTNAAWAGTAYPAATLTHSVGADQRTLANYAASDLLYGRAMNVARTKNPVPLTFYHLLSKVQVAIVAEEGLTASDIQSITIGGTKRSVTYTLSKSAAPNAIGVTAAGSASAITIGQDLSADFTEANVRYNDAVVVPQTLSEGTVFLTITLTTGENLVYRLTANTTFESGKKYTCHMTVNLTGITMTTSVADWRPGDLITGNNGIVRYVVSYTDNTSETIYCETMGTVSFNGTGKTVRSIALPDLDKTYLIGRSNLTSLTLNLDAAGNLHFRPAVNGCNPIGSYAEFQLINTVPGALAGDYRQEADLDLLSEEWTPIGNDAAPFTGKFDGNGFNLAKLKIENYSSSYVGLFGYIEGSYAEIRNAHISSGSIKGRYDTASICSRLSGGRVINCSNAAIVSSSYSVAGGIVGRNAGSIVKNCQNTGTILGIGGIVGCNEDGGIITACCNYGNVSWGSYVGGLVGENRNGSIVTACYNVGTISASSNDSPAGGIVGFMSGGIVTACYNTGSVLGTASYVGGIAGSLYQGNVIACYWKSGVGLPTKAVGSTSFGSTTAVTSFTSTFSPDAATYPEWGIGTGETNGWWKNYAGNNNLPQLWWEE